MYYFVTRLERCSLITFYWGRTLYSAWKIVTNILIPFLSDFIIWSSDMILWIHMIYVESRIHVNNPLSLSGRHFINKISRRGGNPCFRSPFLIYGSRTKIESSYIFYGSRYISHYFEPKSKTYFFLDYKLPMWFVSVKRLRNTALCNLTIK